MSTNKIQHVALIMDGNGRWAKKRNLPVTAGHLEGTKNIRNITIAANDLGIKTLTLYAFSTENWKREAKEVEYIMRLPSKFLNDYLQELMDNNVVIKLIGEPDRLPDYARKPIQEAEEKTMNNTGLILNLCLNYGGQREIVLAVQNIIKEGYRAEDVNENVIASHLLANNCNPVDLVIRTSGEQRISNFLLWQIAYSELYFTDKLWPDFSSDNFKQIIQEVSSRERRFGGRIK